METKINIKFDEEQLDDIVKRITEKLKEDLVTILTIEKPKKRVRMYLKFNKSALCDETKRLYFSFACNTLNKDFAAIFDLGSKFDQKQVEWLKSQGWKEEVFYK